jgi:RNA polymerase sigma-70 factor (ECF subfamily)
MNNQAHLKIGNMDATFMLERPRLIRLCTTLVGNAEVAEDLAQETLLEAWLHLHDLRDPSRFQQWLTGIARNICLRWLRKQGRELARRAEIHELTGEREQSLEETLADDYDIEVELERKELIELLDRSLAQLPSDTRTVLIERYVNESPLIEVAERLSTNHDAIAMRLQRGKLALKRVLLNEMSLMGTGEQQKDTWEQTSLWCFQCGLHKLLVCQFNPDEATLLLKCLGCGMHTETMLAQSRESQMFTGIKGVRPATTRLLQWINRYYQPRQETLMAACLFCGRLIPFQHSVPVPSISPASFHHEPGLSNHCVTCNISNWSSLDFMLFSLPETQRFWKEHPRLRTLPQQDLEVAGRPALLTTFESVTEQVRLDIVTSADSFIVLNIYGGST